MHGCNHEDDVFVISVSLDKCQDMVTAFLSSYLV